MRKTQNTNHEHCQTPPLPWHLSKVGLDALQRCFDAEAAGRALTGCDVILPLEVLDALRAGLEVGGAARTGMVTLADFERYHQVSNPRCQDRPAGCFSVVGMFSRHADGS